MKFTANLQFKPAFIFLCCIGFGSVYLAKKRDLGHLDDGKLFALKTINITRAVVKEAFHNEDFLTGERAVT